MNVLITIASTWIAVLVTVAINRPRICIQMAQMINTVVGGILLVVIGMIIEILIATSYAIGPEAWLIPETTPKISRILIARVENPAVLNDIVLALGIGIFVLLTNLGAIALSQAVIADDQAKHPSSKEQRNAKTENNSDNEIT